MNELLKAFEERFQTSSNGVRFFYSGGRVNLIGEHTDYNDGYVFPAALSLGSYVCIKNRSDSIVRLAATDLDGVVEADLRHLDQYKSIPWGKYQLGIINEFLCRGDKVRGADILYYDTIPHSGGLSSSAAIQLVTARAIADMNEIEISNVELAQLARRSEHRYIGVQCGVMDQFASAMGKEGHAILLNCKTLEYEYIPLDLKDCCLIIANTNKKRQLADSKYNERFAECQKALSILRQYRPEITALCDLSTAELQELLSKLDDPVLRKRAVHVVSENDRVLKSAEVLKKGDLETFGQYLNESHASLKELYEVTGIELDTLAENAQKMDGVLGSRMTGAGFGGCTVSIVKQDFAEEFCQKLDKIYSAQIGYAPSFYRPAISGGSREVLEIK